MHFLRHCLFCCLVPNFFPHSLPNILSQFYMPDIRFSYPSPVIILAHWLREQQVSLLGTCPRCFMPCPLFSSYLRQQCSRLEDHFEVLHHLKILPQPNCFCVRSPMKISPALIHYHPIVPHAGRKTIGLCHFAKYQFSPLQLRNHENQCCDVPTSAWRS